MHARCHQFLRPARVQDVLHKFHVTIENIPTLYMHKCMHKPQKIQESTWFLQLNLEEFSTWVILSCFKPILISCCQPEIWSFRFPWLRFSRCKTDRDASKLLRNKDQCFKFNMHTHRFTCKTYLNMLHGASEVSFTYDIANSASDLWDHWLSPPLQVVLCILLSMLTSPGHATKKKYIYRSDIRKV